MTVLDSRPRAAPATATRRRPLVSDAAVVLGVLLVLGVVAGLLWPQLVEPVRFVRTADGISSDEVQLAHQFDDEGWYVVLAAVAGALAGAVLTAWRSRDPIATVVLLLLGTAVAAWVMTKAGEAVGPPPVTSVLRDADVGATAPGPVEVRTWAAYLVWPIAALFGATVVLWTRREPHDDG